MTGETHVFILWHRGAEAYHFVLKEIEESFDVLEVLRMQWTPAHFSNNLTRFYGQKLPRGCNKQKDCGTGPFLLFVVFDPVPRYEIRHTTSGEAWVNVHAFDLKARLRSPAGGNLPIHASDTAAEAVANLTLLLGPDEVPALISKTMVWDRRIAQIGRDIAGAHGWSSLSEMFAVANATMEYLVIRNFEFLPERYEIGAHGDIDLLVNNLQDARLLLNAIPTTLDPGRVQHTVLVGGKSILIDLRYVGDGYFDEAWERHLLSRRQRTQTDIYVPDEESHFFTLLYHAAVHKSEVASDYAGRLTHLADSLGINLPACLFGSQVLLRTFLMDYMRQHGYRFTRPIDASVHFNTFIARMEPWQYLKSIFKASMSKRSSRTVPLPTSDASHAQAAVVNLMRPFTLGSKPRILELGSTSYEMTRFFADSATSVVVVEGDPAMYSEMHKHCKDCATIEVIAQHPLKFDQKRLFDVVVFLGFQEYAASQSFNEDAIVACLNQAASFLNPDGFLVLAIQNQLGLKYFNGCDEDQLGKPYYGLHGLYRPNEPSTFGRMALENKLVLAGLRHYQFFYPFPDYKLPEVILSDAALADPDFDAAALLAGMASRNPRGHFHSNFHEHLAWRPVLENGLLSHLANSFLIFAAANKDALSKLDNNWLASTFTTGRIPGFSTETRFLRSGDAIKVKKRRLHPEATVAEISLPTGRLLHKADAVSEYVCGRPYLLELQQRLGRGEGVAGVIEWAAPWIDLLLENSIESDLGRVLPGEWLDAIPQNFIRDMDGKLQRIDEEWIANVRFPISLILLRGLMYSFLASPTSEQLRDRDLMTLSKIIMGARGINFSQADVDFFIENEATLASVLENQDLQKHRQRIISVLTQRDYRDMLTPLSSEYHERMKNQLESEISRIKRTLSWQMTKPFRAIWNLLIHPVLRSLLKKR